MLPSLSLNHAARVGPVVAMPLWVLRLGKSCSVEWCAWQELNLLPFGPEPNALSGELQARAG